MPYDTLLTEIDDGVMTLTLNRPDRLNALTEQMIRDLLVVLDEIDANDDVRAVIVTGAGRGFCAGADLAGGAETFDSGSGGGRNTHVQRAYGGAGTQVITGACLSPLGDGFVFAGRTDSVGAGLADAWVIKTDLQGRVSAQCPLERHVELSARDLPIEVVVTEFAVEGGLPTTSGVVTTSVATPAEPRTPCSATSARSPVSGGVAARDESRARDDRSGKAPRLRERGLPDRVSGRHAGRRGD